MVMEREIDEKTTIDSFRTNVANDSRSHSLTFTWDSALRAWIYFIFYRTWGNADTFRFDCLMKNSVWVIVSRRTSGKLINFFFGTQ